MLLDIDALSECKELGNNGAGNGESECKNYKESSLPGTLQLVQEGGQPEKKFHSTLCFVKLDYSVFLNLDKCRLC
jgi:hypothetical protein